MSTELAISAVASKVERNIKELTKSLGVPTRVLPEIIKVFYLNVNPGNNKIC